MEIKPTSRRKCLRVIAYVLIVLSSVPFLRYFGVKYIINRRPDIVAKRFVCPRRQNDDSQYKWHPVDALPLSVV